MPLFYLTPIMSYMMFLLMLFASMLTAYTNNLYIIQWELFHIMSSEIKLSLMLEWSNTMYSSIVLLISANVLKFSKNYMILDSNKNKFTYIVLLFIMSMNLLIFIPNMMCLLIGWDGLGITSFLLIIYYNNYRPLSAGMLTMLTNRLSDSFLLMSIVSTLDTSDWLTINNMSFNNLQWLGILMAAMTKSAQMPYSSWLPAAMAAPTPVSALIHSSTLVTAGVFLLYRFNNMISTSSVMQTLLMLSGISTTLIASISAIHENDMKKIIVLSTLSQLGLMITCLSLKLTNLAFFHMSTHATFKSLLFISAGCYISSMNHNQDLRMFGFLSNQSPIICSSMTISSAALMGIPFMAGYYSKHAIMEWSNTMIVNMIIYSMMLLAITLTSYYSMRLITFMLLLPPTQQAMLNKHSSHNNNYPLLMMSMSSITSGSLIEWSIPQITKGPPNKVTTNQYN